MFQRKAQGVRVQVTKKEPDLTRYSCNNYVKVTLGPAGALHSSLSYSCVFTLTIFFPRMKGLIKVSLCAPFWLGHKARCLLRAEDTLLPGPWLSRFWTPAPFLLQSKQQLRFTCGNPIQHQAGCSYSQEAPAFQKKLGHSLLC